MPPPPSDPSSPRRPRHRLSNFNDQSSGRTFTSSPARLPGARRGTTRAGGKPGPCYDLASVARGGSGRLSEEASYSPYDAARRSARFADKSNRPATMLHGAATSSAGRTRRRGLPQKGRVDRVGARSLRQAPHLNRTCGIASGSPKTAPSGGREALHLDDVLEADEAKIEATEQKPCRGRNRGAPRGAAGRRRLCQRGEPRRPRRRPRLLRGDAQHEEQPTPRTGQHGPLRRDATKLEHMDRKVSRQAGRPLHMRSASRSSSRSAARSKTPTTSGASCAATSQPPSPSRSSSRNAQPLEPLPPRPCQARDRAVQPAGGADGGMKA